MARHTRWNGSTKISLLWSTHYPARSTYWGIHMVDSFAWKLPSVLKIWEGSCSTNQPSDGRLSLPVYASALRNRLGEATSERP